MVNFYSRGNLAALAFTLIGSMGWYAMVILGAVAAGVLAAGAHRLPWLEAAAPQLLLFAFIFWQVVPIFLTSTGVGLDLKRLIVYPISHRELFGLEVILRFSTGLEMVVILAAVGIGLLLNPRVPWWGPLAFLPWLAFNLFLSAGLRDLLSRMLARRGIREVAALGLVLLAALPQLLLLSGIPEPIRRGFDRLASLAWPWQLTARLAFGHLTPASLAALLAWTAGAGLFGWWQFQRGLRFDAEAARASSSAAIPQGHWRERLYRLPSALLSDPLAAIVEKELRFLSRAPRFRLVFIMGFSFGLLIWLPLAFDGFAPGVLASNYLTFVTVYALMLLGEVTIWNAFGFDRSAVQAYLVAPVSLSQVLIAKNIAAVLFVLLEVTAVALVCGLLRMPLNVARLAESYAVTLVFTVLLLAVGNLSSVYYPRPVNPAQSWRSASAGRVQALLLILYPLLSLPIGLAYLARYALDSQPAFYAVLGVAAVFAAVFYWVSLDSAMTAVAVRKERIVQALSEGDGPVTA